MFGLGGRTKRRSTRRYIIKETPSKPEKRPWEFKKKLAAWAVVIATLAVIAPYALSLKDKETVGDVSTTVFTGCIGYLISYAASSTTEKISRNRHGLDADGNPYNQSNMEE